MTALIEAWWSGARWRVRRFQVRQRLREALAAERNGGMVPVGRLVRRAGLGAAPRCAVDAALTDLVEDGLVEGLRGETGWYAVRGRFSQAARRLDTGPAAVRTAPPAAGTGAGRRRGARGTQSGVPAGTVPHLDSRMSLPEAGVAHGSAGAWGGAVAAALPRPGAARTFSVAARLPARRDSGRMAGLLLFAVALLAAAIAVPAVVRRGADADPPGITTRADWYREVARGYVAAHLAHRSGFGLPHGFTGVSGVPAGAPRAALERGMETYVQAALFTGFPSQTGLLAWARGEFGELPAGPAGDAWIHRVAETYAARTLAGTPGYELTPALRATGGIAAEERDPTALTAGIDRAVRAALFTGTPELGGVLDWARRTYGELPGE